MRYASVVSLLARSAAVRKRILNPLLALPAASTALVIICICTIAFSGGAQAQTQPSANCQPIAYLPSMATFGGPSAIAAGNTELGLAIGNYSELLPSPCGHVGAEDWLLRFRRATSDRLDFGFDLLTNYQADKTLGGTPDVAVRYLLTPGLRLEGGVGFSDASNGRDLSADVGAVLGTHNPTKTWNYYMSLRLGGSRGCLTCGSNTNHAPGALVPLGVIGTTARVSNNTQFVMEAGMGGIFARQYSSPAYYFHISFGVLFNVGKQPHPPTSTP